MIKADRQRKELLAKIPTIIHDLYCCTSCSDAYVAGLGMRFEDQLGIGDIERLYLGE